MSGANGGKYQSGREIFEKFIPNYETTCSKAERSILEEPTESATAEIIDDLLKDFSKHLSNVSKNKTQNT